MKNPEESIKGYHDAIRTIRTNISNILAQRETNDNTRFCVWDGQSTDGRKHEIDVGDKVLPFEGASDARIRTADKIIVEHVAEIVLAATRIAPKVKGVESGDENKAGKIWALLKWLKDNQWGSDFRDQIELLCQYIEGDTPAAALLWVDWVKEKAIAVKEIDTDELLTILTDSLGEEMTDELLVDIIKMLNDPIREAELVALLRKQFPNLSQSTAKKIAVSLRENDKADFPLPYLKKNIPVIKAKRLFEDVFVNPNIREFQRSPEVFDREWLIKAEVEERAATEKWDKEFTKQLIGDDDDSSKGKEGLSAFEEGVDVETSKTTNLSNPEPRKGYYEVLTVYEYKTDDDGAMCIWTTTFSGLIDIPAKPSEIFKRAHGKYPYVMFTRENVRPRKLDSRGIPELAQTHQSMQKLGHDAFNDHVQITTNPPLKVLQGKVKYQVTLAPFGQIEQGPRENVEYLARPPFPQSAEWMNGKLDKDIDEYFGRPNKEIDPSFALIRSQDRIDRFLSSLKDVYAMVIQLCQEFMDDEQLQRIIGKNGQPIARTIDEIQGQYDLTLTFDMRDLDIEYVSKKAKLYVEVVKQLDTKATVQWDQGVRRLMEAIDPFDADVMLIPSDVADEREIEDEKLNYSKMLAGIEPKMTEGAINAQARLNVINEENQKRQQFPQEFGAVSPASIKIIENRMKYLTFQLQQQENAQTGRLGTKPLGPEEMMTEGEAEQGAMPMQGGMGQ
jgi:hypothetical protein